MKKIVTLLSFCFVAGMVMAQTPALKVASDANIGMGGEPNILGFGTGVKLLSIHSDAKSSTIEMKGSRTSDGQTAAFFSFINNADRLVDFAITRQAAGKSGNFAIRVNNGAGGTGGGNMVEQVVVANSTGYLGLGTNAPTERLHVAGNIFHSGTITMSDKRLKKSVKSMDMGLKQVLALNPVRYQYNGKGGSINGDEHIGLIAQELQKVSPFLVKEFTHKEFDKEDSVEGELNLKSEETFLAIKDNEIKYLLINAIKEQQELLTAQSERISALEEIIANIADRNTEIDATIQNKNVPFLGQNSPNPFNGETTIAYNVPETSQKAAINIFSVNGQLLKTVDITTVGAGTVNLSALNMNSGTYTYSLTIDGKIHSTNKMIITQ